MGYIIDTCIWIDVERGILSPADVANVTKDAPVFLSPVTVAELKFGVENSQNQDIRMKRLLSLAHIKSKPVLTIDAQTGEIFGEIAAQIRKNKMTHDYRVQDIWIASQAVQHSFRLLTHNRKDFIDIPGLLLVVWNEVFRKNS